MRVTNYMALKANMGVWDYYVTTMRSEDVVTYVKFAEEVNPNPALDFILQRKLAKRSEKIADFLTNNSERFFGSLIIAVYGGNSKFKRIEIEGEDILGVPNPGVGVLQFDGREKYYVLDGQHRVAALRSLSDQPVFAEGMANELISVVLISHPEDDEGIQRARRLFTNLNRYAVKTNKGVNVALDEDDGYAILSRRILRSNDYFSDVVKVAKPKRDGGFDLITGEALHKTADIQWLMTLPTFYECNKGLLGKKCSQELVAQQQRPDEEILSDTLAVLLERWNIILEGIDIFMYSADTSTREYVRNGDDGGHPLLRPIGIKAFTLAAGEAFDADNDVAQIVAAGSSDDRLADNPWDSLLWNSTSKRMEAGKARMNVAKEIYRMRMRLEVDEAAIRTELDGYGASL